MSIGFTTALQIGYTAKGQRDYQTFQSVQEFFLNIFDVIELP